jgi:hypothetical protein
MIVNVLWLYNVFPYMESRQMKIYENSILDILFMTVDF